MRNARHLIDCNSHFLHANPYQGLHHTLLAQVFLQMVGSILNLLPWDLILVIEIGCFARLGQPF